jgi:Leucine Rich repeats (2 copies)
MHPAHHSVIARIVTLVPGLFGLVLAHGGASAQARTLRIDNHSKLVQTLMERHRPGTRYRIGAKLRAKGDLDADWITIRNATLLRQLTWLRSLSLSRASVPGFVFLKNLGRLERLDLSKTRITSLGPLARLTRLRQLDLSSTGVRDVRPLAKLTSLMDLRLSETRVRDLTSLHSFTLARLELGSPKMARPPNLSTLTVDTLVITDAGPRPDLTPLARARIGKLVLDATGVKQLRGLEKNKTLQVISLRQTQVTLQTIRALLTQNRALQIITPKGRTVGRVITWVRTPPRVSDYPCLQGQGPCTRETFAPKRQPIVRWIAP